MRQPTPEHRRDRETRTTWLHPDAERRLRHDLAELPELLALVAANPNGVRRGGSGRRSTPGSRPPASVEGLALTDRRTRQDDADVIGCADLDRMGGRRDGIEPTIRSWVLLAEGEMLDEGVAHTDIPAAQRIGDDCAWLARHIVWILEQQWVLELADAVRRMVRDCEQYLHIRPEYRPRCPQGCGGRLRDEGSGLWRCGTCERTAGDRSRLGLRQLVVAEEPMTAEEIGRAWDISASTIREWRERGWIEPTEDGPRPRYHPIDVLRLAVERGLDGDGVGELAAIAEKLGIPVKTLHRWRAAGWIEPVDDSTKRGRRYRLADVEAVAARVGRMSLTRRAGMV